MKTKKVLFIKLFLLFLFAFASGTFVLQAQTVQGIVRDADTGQTLPGVNIVLEGTTVRTVTDVNGQYSLRVPAGSNVLVFSFIGYTPQLLSVNVLEDEVLERNVDLSDDARPVAGGMFAGGALNFTVNWDKDVVGNTTTEGPTRTNLTIMPMGGMFLDDNLAIGAGIGFTRQSVKRTVGGTETVNSQNIFRVAPFARYYMSADQAGLFAHVGLDLGFGGTKTKTGGTVTDGPGILTMEIGLRPGIYYYLTPNLSIDARFGFIGYSLYREKDANDNKLIDSTFSLRLDARAFNFGLYYHL